MASQSTGAVEASRVGAGPVEGQARSGGGGSRSTEEGDARSGEGGVDGR